MQPIRISFQADSAKQDRRQCSGKAVEDRAAGVAPDAVATGAWISAAVALAPEQCSEPRAERLHLRCLYAAAGMENSRMPCDLTVSGGRLVAAVASAVSFGVDSAV